MRRATGSLLVVILSRTLPAIAHAQQKFPSGKFVNLQIFPKETTAPVLIAAMKNFTRDLGVRCQFCHVGEERLPLETFDFPADVKAQKQSARMMFSMTAEINAQAMPDAPAKGYQVTCYTCHRGAVHPQHVPDATKPPGPGSRD
jgi:hypothetical protein